MKKSILFRGEKGDPMEIYINEEGLLEISMDIEFPDLEMPYQDESKYIVLKKEGVKELIKTLTELEKEIAE